MSRQSGGTAGNSSRQIGSYDLLNTLGLGGTAKVYRGRHKVLETEAAVKVLHGPMNAERAKEFRNEARTIANLRHDNIVRVLEFGVENSIPFLVMDYAPGGSLKERLSEDHPFPLNSVVSSIRQVSAALQYAHDNGVVHRDIKPANILLSQEGKVLLGDFGIAVDIRVADTQTIHNAAGTVLYIAPEQIFGYPEAASDQYSTAIVTYVMLTGSHPFTGTRDQIIDQHINTPPPSMRRRNPHVPIAVERVVMKALSKNPKRRYPSVSAFADALEEASRQDTGRPHSRTVTTRSSRPGAKNFFAFFALFVALLVIVGSITVVSTTYPAIVTITSKNVHFMKNYTLFAVSAHPDADRHQIDERSITSTSPPRALTVKATGIGQTQGIQSSGALTFYNGLSIPQTVPAHTQLATSTSIVVVTDEPAVMKAANPPNFFGTVTVAAHVLTVGVIGNISPDSIDQTCCTSDGSITVKNLIAFSGGQDPQTYSFVRKSDVDHAATSLTGTATAEVHTLLLTQLRSTETLYAQSLQCNPHVSSYPNVNERAANVTITVSITCTGNVYDRVGASRMAGTLLKADAQKHLGMSYILDGNVSTDLIQVVSADIAHSIIVLLLKVEGVWFFQFSNARRQLLVQLIKGKSTKRASSLLSQQDGVSKVDIQIPWWVPWIIRDTLPTNMNRIRLVVVR